MDALKKYFHEKWIGFAITLVSIFVVSMLHLFGIFDVLELKSYDYRFTNVRGPLTGWPQVIPLTSIWAQMWFFLK